MSNLLNLTHRLDRAVSDYLGEELLLVPTREGEFDSAVDETRQGGVFFGTLVFGKESAELGGATKNWGGRVAVSGAVLKVGENQLPANATVQKNDVIIARERGDQAFKVAMISTKLGSFEIELDDAG